MPIHKRAWAPQVCTHMYAQFATPLRQPTGTPMRRRPTLTRRRYPRHSGLRLRSGGMRAFRHPGADGTRVRASASLARSEPRVFGDARTLCLAGHRFSRSFVAAEAVDAAQRRICAGMFYAAPVLSGRRPGHLGAHARARVDYRAVGFSSWRAAALAVVRIEHSF